MINETGTYYIVSIKKYLLLRNTRFLQFSIFFMGVASRKPGVGPSWKSSTLLVINERIIRKNRRLSVVYESISGHFKIKLTKNQRFFGKKTAKK